MPNRGRGVSRRELDQVCHIDDVRDVLEGLCARLATQNVPNESWRDLLAEFSGPVEEEVKNGDFETYTEVYGQFRMHCIDAAGNPELTRALDSIYEQNP